MIDVARLAGVSQTTVSFVVNNRPASGISQETRARVLAAVQKLDYQPNRAAAGLRRRRSFALGFHVSQSMLARSDLFALSFLPALIRAADEHDYQVMAFTDHGDEVARLADLVRTQAVDGFVLTDTTSDDPRARYLAESGSAFAAMGRLAPDLPQWWVDIDNVAAMRLALDHLAATGHDDIAFVMPDATGYWWEERLSAFVSWAREKGLEHPASRIVRAPMSEIGDLVGAMLDQTPRPTAILGAGDAVVVPCYRAASRRGLRIGIDLAVVGFDPLLWMLDPPLTTLTFPHQTMARLLVTRVLAQVESGGDASEGILVETELVIRGSA
jgi:DNA-binding LacI/PurR family transcriptional regulator